MCTCKGKQRSGYGNLLKTFKTLSLLKVDSCEIKYINPYNPHISTLQQDYCKKRRNQDRSLFKITKHQLEYEGGLTVLSFPLPQSTESEVRI